MNLMEIQEAIAIGTFQLVCVFLFISLFCVIWSILAWILFYFPICVFLFCEWMNERFTNHTTCCAVFVFSAVDVFYLVPHTSYRWRRVNIFFSLSDWNISCFFFLFVRTKILRQIIAASYYILWTQVGSIIGFKSDAHLEANQKNQVYRSNLRAIGFAFSPWK